MRPAAARVLFIALAIGLVAGLGAMQLLSLAGVRSAPVRMIAAYLISVGASLIIMSIAHRTETAKERRSGAPGIRPDSHPDDPVDLDPDA